MRGCPIKVDDEIFDTMAEAAKFLEMNPYDLSGTLTDNEEHEVKGFIVKRLGKRRSRLGGQIYCYKNGKLYKNALVLGKILGVNPAYISQKLRAENKYVDIFGNTYRRVQNPENFKNVSAIEDSNDDITEISSTKVDKIQEELPVKVLYNQNEQPIENNKEVEENIETPTVNNIYPKDSIESAVASLRFAINVLLDKRKFNSAKEVIDIIETLYE